MNFNYLRPVHREKPLSFNKARPTITMQVGELHIISIELVPELI